MLDFYTSVTNWNVKKPMNAYSMHLKILHRLIFSQIYTGVWDIDFVLLLIKSFFAGFFFFGHSFGKDRWWFYSASCWLSFYNLSWNWLSFWLQHALKQQTEALAEGSFQQKFWFAKIVSHVDFVNFICILMYWRLTDRK